MFIRGHIMKRFSKIMALGLATTIMMSGLIACGKKQVEEPPVGDTADVVEDLVAPDVDRRKTEQEEVTIRTVSQFGGADPSAQVYQTLLTDFQTENPEITVEDESGTVDQEWKAKIATDFAADNQADVIYTFTGLEAKLMIEQEKVVPLDEIRSEFPDYGSNIFQDALKSVKEFDGNTYAIPVRGFYQGLFVNKILFEENDIDLPSDWEKMELAIETFKNNNILPIAAALGDQPDYWVDHLILSQGGLKAHSNQDIASVKEEWVAGLEYLKTLYDMGAFPKDTHSTKEDIITGMFVKGEAAMLLGDNRVIEKLDNPDNFTVLPLPVLPGGRVDEGAVISGFSAGWYITRSAWEDPAKRTAAVKFVEAMTRTEAIEEFVASGERPSADVGQIEGLAAVAFDGLAMQVSASEMHRPINSWLGKPAWEQLLNLVPAMARGQEDIAGVVDKIITLDKEQ